MVITVEERESKGFTKLDVLIVNAHIEEVLCVVEPLTKLLQDLYGSKKEAKVEKIKEVK